MKKSVLVFCGFYTPGFKGGGPSKTIANTIDSLGDEFRFSVITSDRDLGDEEPYARIKEHLNKPSAAARRREFSAAQA